MRPRSAWLLPLVAACTGSPIAQTMQSTVPAPAPDVFECLRREIKQIGWTQTSHDVDALRLTARKFDEEATRPDVQFRRIVHRLTIQVNPETSGTGSTVTTEAATYRELQTHRGPTEEQEPTAPEALEAARTLTQRCTDPAASVPE